MNKKIIPLSILLVILIGGIIPQTATATQNQSSSTSSSFRFFKFNTTLGLGINQIDIPTNPLDLNSSIELDVDTCLFITPQDSFGPFSILSIFNPFAYLSDDYLHETYFILLTRFFPDELAGKIMFRDKNHEKAVNITLSVEVPEWCTVELENTTLTQDFLDFMSNGTVPSTKLKVKINEDAPSLQVGEIKVTANFVAEGDWIFTSEVNTTSFTVMPKYSGNITATIEPLEILEDVDGYIVSQNESTTFPLNITNNFNGETKVAIEFGDNVNVTDLNWTISLDKDEVIIPKGETKTVNIIVNSSSSKNLEEIQQTFKLTPMSTVDANLSDQYLFGDSIEVSTGPIIKEEIEESIFEIDTTLLAVVLLIIVVVIIAIVIFIKRK